ncbi:polyadenylate-binding protein RBP45-like isoform X2 [Cornus florida]|uniref:polyadenylate-binding protein RBP45-like isoform X2 n=1 Tax=Cornus florida TaxID=4283 RepID=UPI00289C052F|nr:polyadenylate-binding protein RBP45-like isoform X2 [Cornus florida]
MMQPANQATMEAQQNHQYQQQQQQQQHQQWMMMNQQLQQQQQQQHHQQAPPQPMQPQPQPPMYYHQQPPQQHQHQLQQPQAQYTAAAQPASADEIRTLWIGDLQYWMDEQYLLSCFAHTGEVASAKIIRNKQTAQSEGYGFIDFVSRAAAERNLQSYSGTLMPNSEQNFRLNWASFGVGEKRPDDTPDFSIFVGDLAADVTDYMLQETFRAHFPSVKGAKVVTDKTTGRMKGYGFVMFGDENEQLRAMSEMNGRFCSTRPMRIGPAANKKSVGSQQYPKAMYQGTQNEDDPNNTTIFVGGLDSSVTDDSLKQVFSQYGQLIHVKIPVGKRCGFVQFADRSCAEEALRMLNGTQLGGQNIRLSWGRSPLSKQPQVDPNQWNGGVYGYAPGYETYGYASAAQDPNLYYGVYPGYGNYPPPMQQQQQLQ